MNAESGSFIRMNRPSAVIFDWDNTLVDSWPVIQDALNVTLTAFGHDPWTLDETKRRVRKSMRDSFPGLFGDAWEKAGEVFYERYAQIHHEKIQPLPGAHDLLKALVSAEIPMAVVSNKMGDYLRDEARHLGWERYFSRLVGATDAARDKPARDPIDLALADTGVIPGPSVWFVGDADIDMECAGNAGCGRVLVRAEPPVNGEFETHPPDHYVSSCEALCNFVKGL